MDATQVKTKLIGYGFSLLEGIDPNPEVIIFDYNTCKPIRKGISHINHILDYNKSTNFVYSTELRMRGNYSHKNNSSRMPLTVGTKYPSTGEWIDTIKW